MNRKKLLHLYITTLTIASIVIGIIYLFSKKYLILPGAILFIILTYIPNIINKKYKFPISNAFYFYYATLIFTGFFLGGCIDLYRSVYWWDNAVHFLSGITFYLFGYLLGGKLNIKNRYLPFFSLLIVILSAFSWELLEFICDSIFNSNLQEYKELTKEPFVPLVKERGHALVDTMMDMIYAILGFIVTYIIFKIKLNKKEH